MVESLGRLRGQVCESGSHAAAVRSDCLSIDVERLWHRIFLLCHVRLAVSMTSTSMMNTSMMSTASVDDAFRIKRKFYQTSVTNSACHLHFYWHHVLYVGDYEKELTYVFTALNLPLLPVEAQISLLERDFMNVKDACAA
jgi:hypothetical protein